MGAEGRDDRHASATSARRCATACDAQKQGQDHGARDDGHARTGRPVPPRCAVDAGASSCQVPVHCGQALTVIPAEDRPLPRESHAGREIRYSTCYMCACRCGIKVTTMDGELRFIEGTREHPVNQGVLCAKGSAGIMKQRSPAKLRKPLKRREGSERGAGVFDEIEWDEAYRIIEARLAAYPRHRSEAPRVLHRPRPDAGAHRPLGAAIRHAELGCARRLLLGQHGGGGPVLDRLFVLGVRRARLGPRANTSCCGAWPRTTRRNPIKIGLDKLKRNGAKFVSINPIRTGYSAIADEWMPDSSGHRRSARARRSCTCC